MNPQQAVPPRSSANGFNKMTTAGYPTGDKGGGDNREWLVYLTSCLIGHPVEVQVADGSVYSGIFHATNAESDFGVILKMACLTKAGSSEGHKSISDFVNKTPTKTLIIPSRQLVQIVGKSVPVTKDGLTDEFQHEKQQEIMTDTSISRSRHVELERELEPWVPDDDNIECPELDNTFDRHWNRGWDQFETNAALFGVTSTFDEELYTTKLDRGPMMREREREALRIAREIEGEDTKDLHLAEERGIHVHSNFDLDEETKYSSVMRGVDDSGYEENEDIWDSENNETFGNVSDNTINKSSTGEKRIHVNRSSQKKDKRMLFEQYEASKLEDAKKDSFEKGLSADATAYAPSNVMSKAQETTSSSEVSESPTTVKIHEATQPATSTSECGNVQSAASAPGLSPSSSMNSLNSEKSTLNPHAKEFKFNPNAKSFVPLQTPVRPASPASDGSYYYPPNAAPVSHMQMGTSFAPHQPVMYGPQTTSYQPQQPYFQPNIPQFKFFGLFLVEFSFVETNFGLSLTQYGQPRQMMYMPTYPPFKFFGLFLVEFSFVETNFGLSLTQYGQPRQMMYMPTYPPVNSKLMWQVPCIVSKIAQ
ncbi:lsmAD domain, Ataxin 2, SM domain protein [Artemisia annua]|uniref:LsmAD domain, Ataxin 2, SM domain protein n=1 Tax=Artemisia annua TaxID=35608 RepID=A0A2U1QHL0_ARTAN|nr:lsmAD domain, Ataxin 2, SM domain protein [Artemisia annua]